MSKTAKPTKPSRAETLRRLDAVAREAVGEETSLDAAFARFDNDALGDDPEALKAAQAKVRALLAPDEPPTSH